MKALVGRALRLQEQTSLESLAIQLDEWYRQCAAGYAPEDWQDDEYIEPYMLAECSMPDGWRYVGRGHFSVAVEHASRPDYIFKICCRTGDGYPEYATCACRSSTMARTLACAYRISRLYIAHWRMYVLFLSSGLGRFAADTLGAIYTTGKHHTTKNYTAR